MLLEVVAGPIEVAVEPKLGERMQFVCDGPNGTWFRMETEGEAFQESQLMNHAVEKHFRQAAEEAVKSFVPPASARSFEQNIGLKSHVQKVMGSLPRCCRRPARTRRHSGRWWWGRGTPILIRSTARISRRWRGTMASRWILRGAFLIGGGDARERLCRRYCGTAN
jgi:hypothetical protein